MPLKTYLWDFGGQEIMHATYQFSLTERSLYLLVIDARKDNENKGESNIEYWLKLIQSFGKNSPVLIIINKIDENRLDVNRRGFQEKYPTIKDFHLISCKTGEGFQTLAR